MKEKQGFCLNSRRWLNLQLSGIPSCPYKGYQGLSDCMYENCGYYEEKEVTSYYEKRMKIIMSYLTFG